MNITDRCYQKDRDYAYILSYLREEYRMNPRFLGWKAQRFEDMEYRLNTMNVTAGGSPWHHCIHLWEDDGKIAGLCVGEREGENFFQVRAGYEFLYPEMVKWTKENMYVEEDGKKRHTFWVYDDQTGLVSLLKEQGFTKDSTKFYLMEHPMLEIETPLLPEGFTIVDGEEVGDLTLKSNISHWGFHPEQEGMENQAVLEANKNRLNAPMFDRKFEIMGKSPNGDLCSYAYFWVDMETQSAYVEPVSTLEKYRKMGLGKAMLLAELSRCQERGVTRAFVEPADWRRDFYASAGFRVYGQMSIWTMVE